MVAIVNQKQITSGQTRRRDDARALAANTVATTMSQIRPEARQRAATIGLSPQELQARENVAGAPLPESLRLIGGKLRDPELFVQSQGVTQTQEGTGVPGQSVEEIALAAQRRALEDERNRLAEAGSRLGIDPGRFTRLGGREAIEDALTRARRTAAASTRALDLQAEEFGERARRASAAERALLSPNPEGLIASANVGALQALTGARDRQMEQFNIQFNQQKQRIEDALEEAEIAAATNDVALEEDAKERLRSARAAIERNLEQQKKLAEEADTEAERIRLQLLETQQEQLRAIEQGNMSRARQLGDQTIIKQADLNRAIEREVATTPRIAAQDQARQNLENFFDLADRSDFAFVDDATASQIASSFGISESFINGIRDTKKREIEAQLQGDEIKLQTAELQQVKLYNDIVEQIEGRETQREQNIDLLDKLLKKGTISQKDYDAALREEIGLDEDEPETIQLSKGARLFERGADGKLREVDVTVAGDVIAKKRRIISPSESDYGTITQTYGETNIVQVGIRPDGTPITNESDFRNLSDGSFGTPGIDFAMAEGSDVVSSVSGRVVEPKNFLSSGDMNGLGVKVAVRDDQGNIHFFNHLQQGIVKPGDRVEVNDVIAKSGNTGFSTNPHLDYRVLGSRGKWVNPDQFLGVYIEVEPSEIDNAVASANKPSELKNILSGLNLTSEQQSEAWRRWASEKSAQENKTFEELSFVESALAGIPATLRNAVEERKNFERIISQGMEEGRDFYEVVDVLLGIRPKDEDAKQKFSKLRDNLFTIPDIDESSYRVMMRAINNDQLDVATVNMENSILDFMRETGRLTLPEPTVKFLNKQINDALDILDRKKAAGEDIVGILSGRIEDVRSILSEETDEDFITLNSILTALFAEERRQFAGTALTESEENFLEGLIGTVRDQEGVLRVKLDELKRRIFGRYNDERKDQLLPELTEEDLEDKNLRFMLYFPAEREKIIQETVEAASGRNEPISSSGISVPLVNKDNIDL